MYFFFLYYNKVEDIFIYIEKLYSSGFLVVVWFFFKNKQKSLFEIFNVLFGLFSRKK